MYELGAVIIAFIFLVLSYYVWTGRRWKLLVFLCGVWCILDGLISIFLYPRQEWFHHLPRVLRIVVGTYLIAYVRQLKG